MPYVGGKDNTVIIFYLQMFTQTPNT